MINIKDQSIIDWITETSANLGITSEDLATEIIRKFVKEQTKIIKSSENNPETKLINFFKVMYQKKFHLPTDEDIEPTLIRSVFRSMMKALEDEISVIELLQKAIAWYLFVHTPESADGTRYPYQCRILFEQQWLLRKCIEASQSTDLNIILQAAKQGTNQASVVKAIKRGDIMVNSESNNILEECEKAMKMVRQCKKQFGWNDEIDNHPKIKELYYTDLPTAEYIRKAIKFIETMKSKEENVAHI